MKKCFKLLTDKVLGIVQYTCIPSSTLTKFSVLYTKKTFQAANGYSPHHPTSKHIPDVLGIMQKDIPQIHTENVSALDINRKSSSLHTIKVLGIVQQ